MTDTATKTLPIEKIVNDILGTIDREREREIISRRYGLFDRKETLEQIGELLGITRERVRQLEKAVVIRLKSQAENGQLPHVAEVQSAFVEAVDSLGKVARIQDLTAQFTKDNSRLDQARVSFIAQLCPELSVIEDNDHFHHAVGVTVHHNEKKINELYTYLMDAIQQAE